MKPLFYCAECNKETIHTTEGNTRRCVRCEFVTPNDADLYRRLPATAAAAPARNLARAVQPVTRVSAERANSLFAAMREATNK